VTPARTVHRPTASPAPAPPAPVPPAGQFAVAIAGPGWSGRRFLRTLARARQYQVAAVVGRRPGSVRSGDAVLPVLGAERLPALLSDPALQAVIVCTPPGVQVELAAAALAAGKHVLAEKPVGLRPAGIAMLRETAERGGLSLLAAYQLACNPLLMRARGIVAAGQIGHPVHAAFRMFVPRSRPQASWLADAEASGGPFVETLVHGFHLADWMLGPIAQILNAAPYRHDGAEAGGTVTALHHSGCVTTLETSWLGTDGVRSGFFEVVGTAGAVGWDRGFDRRRRHRLRVTGPPGLSARLDDDDAGFAGLLGQFLLACRSGMSADHIADLHRAERSLRLAIGAREIAAATRPARERSGDGHA
jgi:predicted dehydrogenase